MRKTTLRAYLDMLNMTDVIYAHQFFQRSMRGVVRIYLSILDAPAVETTEDEGVDLSHLSPAERKKEKARLRKLKKKESDAVEARLRASEDDLRDKKKDPKGDSKFVAPKDDDPRGEKLLALDPLEEAARWCHLVQRSSGCDVESHALVADVMLRRNKVISSLKSIIAGLTIAPKHPLLTLLLVKFAKKFINEFGDVSLDELPLTNRIVGTELISLLGGSRDLTQFVNSFAEDARSKSLMHRNSAAKCLVILDNTSADLAARAVALLVDDAIWDGPGVDISTVMETYRVFLHPSHKICCCFLIPFLH
jgi:NMDA receptor-regulated protein 1